jgi:hypothetical protein
MAVWRALAAANSSGASTSKRSVAVNPRSNHDANQISQYSRRRTVRGSAADGKLLIVVIPLAETEASRRNLKSR